ncbi:hypothetical protein D9M68_921360 [compost metagenome]
MVQHEAVARAQVDAGPGRDAQFVGRVEELAAGTLQQPVQGKALDAGHIPVHAKVVLEFRYAHRLVAVVGAVGGAAQFGIDQGTTGQQAQAR